jgi:F-type H+-transporting ATPase subunit alpha
LNDTFKTLDDVLAGHLVELKGQEVGRVTFVGQGIARVDGLPAVKSEELVRFPDGGFGMVFNLDATEVGVVLLGDSPSLKAGSEVRRTGKVMEVPVDEGLVGRMVDPLARPLDNLGPIRAATRLPVERPAPEIMDRAPASLVTGRPEKQPLPWIPS